MFEQRRWTREAWAPICAGLAWLWLAASFGVVGFLFSLIPGCLLLSAGVSTLIYPGDVRIPQFIALGGFLGVPLALPALFVAGVLPAVGLVVLSALSFLAAGAISIRQEPHTEEVPVAAPSLPLAAQVAIDEAILASLALRMPPMHGGEQGRIREEVHRAREVFRRRGWLADPAAYHRAPPPLEEPMLRSRRSGGLGFEHLSFESGYGPDDEEPGRQRWLARGANRTAHAWILRQAGEGRPWLICIHGYEMGFAGLDLRAFRAEILHGEHGLNLALPVLPLHGPRRIGRQSGAGFLSGDFLDTVHAEAQAMWDIRRLLAWIRAQGGGPVGAYGLSLGGYNAALLASLEDLDCVIAGIPAVDFRRLTWRHGAPLQIRFAERHGLGLDDVSEVLSVVSPLALPPRPPRSRRHLFAGMADRIVPPEQPRDLWRHWERPNVVWYPGAHVTFRAHPAVDAMVMNALRDARLI